MAIKDKYPPPKLPVSPLKTFGDINTLYEPLNLMELRNFIVDLMKDGVTEVPLGDLLSYINKIAKKI